MKLDAIIKSILNTGRILEQGILWEEGATKNIKALLLKYDALKNMESSSRVKESADRLILLHRKPNTYEIHRNKIAQRHNLILSTSDEELARKLVESYNRHSL